MIVIESNRRVFNHDVNGVVILIVVRVQKDSFTPVLISFTDSQ